MFLLLCLLVATVTYACSALVSEIFLASSEERELPAPARALLGFLLSGVYFAAAWHVMSIKLAWSLGLVLLLAYSIGAWNQAIDLRARARQAFVAHSKGFGACLAGALLFFAPLFLARDFGPFTEGGGDVTIYADTTKFLNDHELTAKGSAGSSLDDVVANIGGSLHFIVDSRILTEHAERKYMEADLALLNPPAADNALHRLLVTEIMSAFLYVPYGQFSFLAGSTNYHVYYGIQALIYGFLLAIAWFVLAPYGRAIRIAYMAMVVASHGIVSAFYNLYAAQGIALATLVLILALLPRIRVFSRAGLRAYGTATIHLFIAYSHFLSITLPLLVLAMWRRRQSPEIRESARANPVNVLKWLAVAVFAVLVGLLLLAAGEKSVEFIQKLMTGALSGGPKNPYMGGRLPIFSVRWLSFLFGFVSQQHFPPLVQEAPWLTSTIIGGIVVGIACLFLGFAMMARASWIRDASDADVMPRCMALYSVLLLTAGVHIGFAQAYAYMQAKGTQNALLLLYAALPLPLVIGSRLAVRDVAMRWMTPILWLLIGVFVCVLLVPRAVFLYRLASGEDRASIMESSYYSAAHRIREQDPDAFVLFEPRKSADLYLSTQPFAGGRFVPTRHLAINMVDFSTGRAEWYRVDASSLMTEGDVGHLWTLRPIRDAAGRFEWRGERIVTRTEPTLYLFADNYDQDFDERPRGAAKSDFGFFSYVRSGSAMVYLPAGGPRSLELKIAAGDSHAALARDLRERLARGEFSGNLADDGKIITLTRTFAASTTPRMVRVVRSSREYWLNARLDGRELATKERTIGGEKIAGEMIREPSGTSTLRVRWSGIRSPDKQDWIGVFPVGGDDRSRITHAFTQGAAEGSLDMPLPVPAVAPPYELRLFKGGSWIAVATSDPIEAR